MHELGIVNRVLEICLERARQAGAERIYCVQLAIGDLSSVVDDSVVFYWDILTEDTPAEGAGLEFRRIPAEMTCSDCGLVFPMPELAFRCPDCGGRNVRVSTGEEFYIDHIEVEMQEEVKTEVRS